MTGLSRSHTDTLKSHTGALPSSTGTPQSSTGTLPQVSGSNFVPSGRGACVWGGAAGAPLPIRAAAAITRATFISPSKIACAAPRGFPPGDTAVRAANFGPAELFPEYSPGLFPDHYAPVEEKEASEWDDGWYDSGGDRSGAGGGAAAG